MAPVPALQNAYLACNIYCWDAVTQNRLLTEVVRPLIADINQKSGHAQLWYCRFDARGPHLFLVITYPPSFPVSVRDLLQSRICSALHEQPSLARLSEQELNIRHVECRAKSLCTVDTWDGIAGNNTIEFCDQPDSAYPMGRFRAVTNFDRLWRQLNRLSLWSIARLSGSAIRSAILWTAHLTQGLNEQGIPPQTYWSFHVKTLVITTDGAAHLEGRFLREWIQRVVSEKNKTAFEKIWREAQSTALGFDIPDLLDAIFEGNDHDPAERFTLLREINHQIFSQLGVWLKFQVPFLLYAWSRTLPT